MSSGDWKSSVGIGRSGEEEIAILKCLIEESMLLGARRVEWQLVGIKC